MEDQPSNYNVVNGRFNRESSGLKGLLSHGNHRPMPYAEPYDDRTELQVIKEEGPLSKQNLRNAHKLISSGEI